MAINERIHYFRNLRGMTQKFLGMSVGFSEKNADVRVAQYESGLRNPKPDLTAQLAKTLDVLPQALNVPDIESYVGVMHTLFALEDNYGFQVDEIDGVVCLRMNPAALTMIDNLTLWHEQAKKLAAGEITKEEYDHWRYNFPRAQAEQEAKKRRAARRAKLSSEPKG